MKNELVLYNDIRKAISQPRKETVFPLTPTHRKELRILRDANVGNLRERLSFLRKIKEKEFEDKYKKEILKENDKKIAICKSLNDNWDLIIKNINGLLKVRKAFEEKQDLKYLSLDNDYGIIGDLEKVKSDRTYSFKERQVIKDISQEQFNLKYDKPFKIVSDKIDNLVEMYEEAINFGDLEMVKKLYYIMKDADNFFKKIKELEV